MDADIILDKLADSVSTWNIQKAEEYARIAMDEGVSPEDAINKGLSKGMEKISDMFDEGLVFLPQILAASKAMERAINIIEPHLNTGEGHLNGIIVMGSVKGDIHEIGKTVCCAMLRGAGFKVIDLGADVSADKFAEAAQEYEADIVGGSALMTTSLFQQKDIVRVFKEDDLSVMTICGGAPCSRDWVDGSGGDGYSASGSEIVKLVRKLLNV